MQNSMEYVKFWVQMYHTLSAILDCCTRNMTCLTCHDWPSLTTRFSNVQNCRLCYLSTPEKRKVISKVVTNTCKCENTYVYIIIDKIYIFVKHICGAKIIKFIAFWTFNLIKYCMNFKMPPIHGLFRWEKCNQCKQVAKYRVFFCTDGHNSFF